MLISFGSTLFLNDKSHLCNYTDKLDLEEERRSGSARGRDKAWEDLPPFCAGFYVNTCLLTGRAKQGVMKHPNQPLSSDFPTKNKSLRAKPRSTGVYPFLSLLEPLVISCV